MPLTISDKIARSANSPPSRSRATTPAAKLTIGGLRVDDGSVGTAGSPRAIGRKSQSHGATSGSILASALTHKSGGRMRRAICHRPCSDRRMQRRARRIHVDTRCAHSGRSKSRRERTTGAPPGCSPCGSAGAVTGGSFIKANGLIMSSSFAAGVCDVRENDGARRARATRSSFRCSMCGSAEPTCKPSGRHSPPV